MKRAEQTDCIKMNRMLTSNGSLFGMNCGNGKRIYFYYYYYLPGISANLIIPLSAVIYSFQLQAWRIQHLKSFNS